MKELYKCASAFISDATNHLVECCLTYKPVLYAAKFDGNELELQGFLKYIPTLRNENDIHLFIDNVKDGLDHTRVIRIDCINQQFDFNKETYESAKTVLYSEIDKSIRQSVIDNLNNSMAELPEIKEICLYET